MLSLFKTVVNLETMQAPDMLLKTDVYYTILVCAVSYVSQAVFVILVSNNMLVNYQDHCQKVELLRNPCLKFGK